MTSRHVRRLQARLDRTVARYATATQGRPATVAELRANRLPWFEVRDAAGDPAGDGVDVAEVLLFDEIGGSFGIDATTLVEDIARIDAATIRVRINSPGGSVFDALAIMNALRQHDARVVVSVDALAASAATIVAMAGDEIVMQPGSQMMIHDASATEDGNARDMARLATFLDRQSNNIADLYAARAGGTAASWRALMLEETWLFADEAVEAGLADRAERIAEAAPAETRAFDLSAYGFRYAGREQAPAPHLDGREVRSALRGRELRSVATMTRQQSGRRFGDLSRVEVRSEDDGSIRVSGHAALFDVPTTIGNGPAAFEEVIAQGAFAKTLRDGADVRFLFNHNPDLILARTKSGTLTLREDDRGLAVDAHLAPTTTGRDLATLLDRGDVDQMSFGFRATRDQWTTVRRDDGTSIDRRTVVEAQLLDVSGVTYPQYDETDLARREAELARELRSARLPQQTRPPRIERTGEQTAPPATGTPSQHDPHDQQDERRMSAVALLLAHAAGDHVAGPRALCTACAAPAPAPATPDA